jgi:hypothetical protein
MGLPHFQLNGGYRTMRTSSSHHKNRRPDKFAISFLKSVDAVLASAAPWGGSSRSREDFDSYQFD